MLKTIAFVPVAPPSFALAGEPIHVVGGSPVARGAYPDVAAVLAEDAACTGTLIAPDVVLTAGHCIEVHPVEVVLDVTDFTAAGGEIIKVKSATAYPDWERSYDVGVLVLDHPAKERPRAIASACTAAELVDDASVRVVGFGLTDAAGRGDNSELHTALLAVTDAACTRNPDCVAKIAPAGEFVAGGHGKDACFGDSGGPIYLDGALIGVVSRGMSSNDRPCGGGGIYVRADAVAPWIEKTTKRKLTYATCKGEGAADDASDGAAAPPGEGDGGCSAGGGAALPVASLGLVGFVGLRRRRRR